MSNFSLKNPLLLSCFLAITSLSQNALAVTLPDAGQAIQNLNSVPQAPKPTPNLPFESPLKNKIEKGGVRVKISSINISGNSVFSNKELSKIIGDVKGKSFDLAGLQALADKITDYYYKNDYPFARAFITKQTIENGILQIEIVEGRYGDVEIEGEESSDAKAARKFLKPLKTDKVIEGKELERISLILNDQPGYQFIPVMRSGSKDGSGDLTLRMKKIKKFGGNFQVDDYGNRYMGKNRAQVGFYVNSPFMFGDQLSVSSIYSTENMWYGSVGYNLPLGYSGLRGNFNYSNTNYELGKEFESLGAHGNVKILSSGLSYPIIRSQKSNLYAALTYQHKWFSDSQDSTNTVSKKSSNVVPLTFNFDMRDSFLGGAVTYGKFGWTYGVLDLGSRLKAIDRITAGSDGQFNKFNIDISRLQALPIKDLTFFWRASGQASTDNLDSSERFGLGGPGGVRAYPTGESYGDEGGLTQFELRYALQMVVPYAFYDYGHIKTSQNTWSAGNNHRSIAGAGAGLRFNYSEWTADTSIAWRTTGNVALSDSKAETPMIWASLGRRF